MAIKMIRKSHQITDGNDNVVTDKFDGTNKDTLETSGLIKDFPDYVYQQTLVSRTIHIGVRLTTVQTFRS
jgi:hypothetical protein